MLAIEHAHRVLGWQEHLTKDEMPAAWMWPFEEELELWFEEVERLREEKYGSSGGDPDGDSDSGPMLHNELARERR